MSKVILDPESVLNKNLLQALDEISICNICKNIVWNPMECNKCEHCFCKNCIDNWLIQSHTCPFKCSGMSFKESRMIRSMLSNLLFKCGKCGEVIKYENYDNHLIMCPKQLNKGSNISINMNKKKSKYEKYDEVDSEIHEHTLSIVKENHIKFINKKNLDNIYYWSCSLCQRNFALDIKSAYCEECKFEICEECILQKNNQWLVHIII